MKFFSISALCTLLFATACSFDQSKRNEIKLDVLELFTDEAPEITHILNRIELNTWKLNFDKDSLFVMIYNAEMDTVTSNSEGTLSLYDMQLSTSPIQRKKYKIRAVKSEGVNGRVVSREYSDSTNYIELYYKSVCSGKYKICIQGADLSDETYKMMKGLNKHVAFKCND